MLESSEIIRNEFSMCENPLDVLKCRTCPEKVIENEVSVPTVVVIWCSRNECSQCELLRSLRPYHPLWGVSLRIADVVASWWNFQCGLRHVREYLNKLSTPLKAFIRAILINLTRGRAVRRARAAHEPPEVHRGVASSLRTKTCWVWGFQFKCSVDLFPTTAGGGSRKFAREDPYGYVWILPSELGTWAQIQDFLVVLGIVSREARENLHIFRNICTTFSQIWCDLRGFNRAKREKNL